jgi:hypothetical protein
MQFSCYKYAIFFPGHVAKLRLEWPDDNDIQAWVRSHARLIGTSMKSWTSLQVDTYAGRDRKRYLTNNNVEHVVRACVAMQFSCYKYAIFFPGHTVLCGIPVSFS